MNSCSNDPISIALTNSLKDNKITRNQELDNRISASTVKILSQRINFEKCEEHSIDNISEELKKKYTVLSLNQEQDDDDEDTSRVIQDSDIDSDSSEGERNNENIKLQAELRMRSPQSITVPEISSNNNRKPNNSPTTFSSNNNNCKNSPPTLPSPRLVLFPPGDVKIGWREKLPVGSGFINLGTTCYINSTLQALFHIPSFVTWILDDKRHANVCETKNGTLHSECVLCSVSRTLHHSLKATGNSIRPKLIIDKMKLICKHLSPMRQEDAHEFLRYLIESMERSYLSVLGIPIKKLDSYSKETTPLNQIFGGYIRTEVTCSECKYLSTTFQHFQDLILDIRQSNSVFDALEHYFANEALDVDEAAYQCDRCKKKVAAHKKFSIEKPPNVLCIQLKRFNTNSFYGGSKLTKTVTVPQFLDVSKFKHRTKINEMDLHYRLTSMVLHHGNSVNSGHYTALAYTAQKSYWYFNDDNVYTTSFQTFTHSQNAYIIFYELTKPLQLPRNYSGAVTLLQNGFYNNRSNDKVFQPNRSIISNSPASSCNPAYNRPSNLIFRQNEAIKSNGNNTNGKINRAGPKTPVPILINRFNGVVVNKGIDNNNIDIKSKGELEEEKDKAEEEKDKEEYNNIDTSSLSNGIINSGSINRKKSNIRKKSTNSTKLVPYILSSSEEEGEEGNERTADERETEMAETADISSSSHNNNCANIIKALQSAPLNTVNSSEYNRINDSLKIDCCKNDTTMANKENNNAILRLLNNKESITIEAKPSNKLAKLNLSFNKQEVELISLTPKSKKNSDSSNLVEIRNSHFNNNNNNSKFENDNSQSICNGFNNKKRKFADVSNNNEGGVQNNDHCSAENSPLQNNGDDHAMKNGLTSSPGLSPKENRCSTPPQKQQLTTSVNTIPKKQNGPLKENAAPQKQQQSSTNDAPMKQQNGSVTSQSSANSTRMKQQNGSVTPQYQQSSANSTPMKQQNGSVAPQYQQSSGNSTPMKQQNGSVTPQYQQSSANGTPVKHQNGPLNPSVNGYNNKVFTWNGEVSHLNEDQNETQSTPKRNFDQNYNEEFDAGKIKKRKFGSNSGAATNSENNNNNGNYNPIQHHQNMQNQSRMNGWRNQNNINGGRNNQGNNRNMNNHRFNNQNHNNYNNRNGQNWRNNNHSYNNNNKRFGGKGQHRFKNNAFKGRNQNNGRFNYNAPSAFNGANNNNNFWRRQ